MITPEIRIHGLQGFFIYHIITLTLFFRIIFDALVLFQLMKLKILICQIIDSQFCLDKIDQFEILEQILLYIESVHNKYYIKIYLLSSYNFFQFAGS